MLGKKGAIMSENKATWKKITVDNEVYYLSNNKLYDEHFIETPLTVGQKIISSYYSNKINEVASPDEYLDIIILLKNYTLYSCAIIECLKLLTIIETKQNAFYIKKILPILSSCYRCINAPEKSIELIEKYDNEHFTPAFLTSIAAAYCDLNNYSKAKKYANMAYSMQGGGQGYNNELSLVYKRIDKNN